LPLVIKLKVTKNINIERHHHRVQTGSGVHTWVEAAGA